MNEFIFLKFNPTTLGRVQSEWTPKGRGLYDVTDIAWLNATIGI